MEKIFADTRKLDERARDVFDLTEDLMMENAAIGLMQKIESFPEVKSAAIFCGGGNNGADGYALARLLQEKFKVIVVEVIPASSVKCVEQKIRCQRLEIQIINFEGQQLNQIVGNLENLAVVDCIFGSGFHGILPDEILKLVEQINQLNCVKIACDISSGLQFKADVTVTMGGQKIQLYTERGKDVSGKIVVAPLGLCRQKFESTCYTNKFLLNYDDAKLPVRKNSSCHKGNFGHAVIAAGEKIGAAGLSATASLHFGAGYSSVITDQKINFGNQENDLTFELMTSKEIPSNATSFAIGPGFGRNSNLFADYLNVAEEKNLPVVLDADAFYYESIDGFLNKRCSDSICLPTVLTPHPKEFAALLSNCGLGRFTTEEVLENLDLCVDVFCRNHPGIVLLVKGSIVTIAVKLKSENDVFVYKNPWGTNALAKAGSGDVLTGLINGLLAQNYSALDAAITASLVHAKCSESENNFSLTPFGIIQNLDKLNF